MNDLAIKAVRAPELLAFAGAGVKLFINRVRLMRRLPADLRRQRYAVASAFSPLPANSVMQRPAWKAEA